MIINNFTFEETIIKPKQIKNKVALQESLLSNNGEDIDIDNYNPKTIIELIPQRITATSQVVLTKLLNKNLSDECLRKILRILIQWESDKNVELSNLYNLLFNHSMYNSKSKIDDFTFNNEELIDIVNQLIQAFHQAISNNPAAIDNITAWITLLVDNNRLLMPIKETTKLLELVKQYQKYQESIRNIKQLISLPPVQVKKQSVVTHVYF